VPRRIGSVLALALVVVGCAAGPDDRVGDRAKIQPVTSDPPPNAPPSAPPNTPTSVNGLALRVDAPNEVLAGTPIDLDLVLANTGASPLRLFWIEAESFRAQQSRVGLVREDGTPVTPPPISRGHGYVVGEKDFPLLAPGAERRAHQRIATVGLPPGSYRVRWTYGNTVDRWTGAGGTLDGPGTPLFGGGPIPGIWLGEASASAAVVIKADPNAPPSIGSATIARDGTITLTLRATDGQGTIGDGQIVYGRAHPDYEKVRAHTGLHTVGQVVEVRPFPTSW
jgi:hypothetical protein